MEHEIDNQDEAIEVIADYLERMGVTGLRQPHDPETFNKSAVIRYLIAEKLEEVLDNPPLRERLGRIGQRRMGPPGGSARLAALILERLHGY